MKFLFHLTEAAINNTQTAQFREAQRMGCLALGLDLLGHEVSIADASPAFRQSPRWKPFARLYQREMPTGIHVVPAETLKGRDKTADVAFKCSVGTQQDHWYLGRCQVLVAHEYDPHYNDHAALLPVPFMVHDSVMDELLHDGLFEAYAANRLDEVRAFYSRPKTGLLGMRACLHHHRRRFCEGAPDWANLGLYTHQPTGGFLPGEHMRWATMFRGGLCLPGTTPKTNLPSLLALLGVAIVSPRFPETCRDTPRISERNAVIFESWEQVRGHLMDDVRLAETVAQATHDYINGWSAMGQARLLAERFS